MIRIAVFILFLVGTTSSLAQERSIRKRADKAFESLAYDRALSKYKVLYKKNSKDSYYVQKIAHSYLKLNDTTQAEVWLKKLHKHFRGLDNQQMYEYAEVLMQNGKHRKAAFWLQQYKDFSGNQETSHVSSNSGAR